MILKELPRQVILKRKKVRRLTDKLKKKDVRFIWEIPTGLSFTYDGARHVIVSEDQLNRFLSDYEKNFGNS